jgi:hypothetical protein
MTPLVREVTWNVASLGQQAKPVVTEEGRLAAVVSRIDLLGVYDRPDADIRQETLDGIIDGELAVRDRPHYPHT